jgi:hypothetical protein
MMPIQKYGRICQNRFIIEEILWRLYPSAETQKEDRITERVTLRTKKKNELKDILQDLIGKKEKDFEIISVFAKRLGGVDRLIRLKANELKNDEVALRVSLLDDPEE